MIFLGIAIAAGLVYLFFFQSSPGEDGLVSSFQPTKATDSASQTGTDQDFLPLLLNVRNIKLDDSIFLDPAFQNLVDSSIVIAPEGNEGRFNPFAPFGVENNPLISP